MVNKPNSLSRAGRVKAMTPIAGSDGGPKQLQGRAKKRRQYAASFGLLQDRRTPNANGGTANKLHPSKYAV
jgi:hypothetical protein